MGRSTLWGTQPHLGRLYWLSKQELYKIYPDYATGTISGKQHYWKTKVKKGEIPMPPKPEQEPTPVEGKLYKTWETSAFNKETQEWTTTTNHGYDFAPDVNAEDTFEPATPAKITPSRRKPVKRDHRVYVAMGDAQIDYRRLDDNTLLPLHDERAMSVARMITADLQPDEIVNLGDNVDLAGLSRFSPDSDHFHRTMGPSFQRAHDYYAELRADNPDAKIVEVSSNHEVRLRNWVLKHMPQMYGVKRPGSEDDYPVMTYPYLANLNHVGVDWIGGYGAAEYFIGGNKDLVARHGEQTATKTQSAASKIMLAYNETNNVHGHAHEMSMATRTLRSGKVLTSLAVGSLCDTTGLVPGFHSAVDDNNMPVHRQQNWQNGIAVIYDYGNSQYQFNSIPIQNGTAFYNGKEYSA